MSSEHTDQEGSVDAQPTGRPKPPPERKFHCTFDPNCKSRFSRSEHLQRHIRKHTGERPFKCDCGRTFSRMDNLRQHAQTVHAGDESNLAAWPSTKIVPVTPVAPLPAEVRVLSRQTSIAAIQAAAEAVAVSEVTAARKAAQLQAAAERANASAAKKAEAKAKRTAAEARGEAGSDPALGSFKRPAPASFSREEEGSRSASGRAKRATASARQAASTARIVSVMPTSRFAIRPPSRKPRERNYESFSSNLSLHRPSILHHLDETAAGGTYGKRRSMGQQASAQAEASVTEPIVLPPFHSVRGPELPPMMSFDRFTAHLGEHDSTTTSHVRGNALSQESFLRSTCSGTSTDALRNAHEGPSRSQPGSRESLQQHHKTRKLSIASLCSAEDSGSSSEAAVAEEASGDRPLGLAMPDLRNAYRQRQTTAAAAAAQTDMAAAIHATTV